MSVGSADLSQDRWCRGCDYLAMVRQLALMPGLVLWVQGEPHEERLCTWIGTHVAAVNRQLQVLLQACHGCFHPWERPSLQVWAAPLAPSCGLAGVCNLQTQPGTLLLDVGRVVPADWLRLVAHEYAHAQAGTAGHHARFAQALTQLCLGLALAPPLEEGVSAAVWCCYPVCQLTRDPLAFWQGRTGWTAAEPD